MVASVGSQPGVLTVGQVVLRRVSACLGVGHVGGSTCVELIDP